MKESELYPYVRDWLLQRGYEVHVELFDADVAALKNGQLTVVELKICASQELLMQCSVRSGWADFVIACIASEPRSLSNFRHHGYGLLQLRNGRLYERCAARPQPWHWHRRRAYRLKKLQGRLPAQPHELAGLPACKALSQQRDMRR